MQKVNFQELPVQDAVQVRLYELKPKFLDQLKKLMISGIRPTEPTWLMRAYWLNDWLYRRLNESDFLMSEESYRRQQFVAWKKECIDYGTNKQQVSLI